jgi:hypothetical protein
MASYLEIAEVRVSGLVIVQGLSSCELPHDALQVLLGQATQQDLLDCYDIGGGGVHALVTCHI